MVVQDQIERHTGSLRKINEASSLDGSNMDEHIKAAVVGRDEADTPSRVEPLHNPARQVGTGPFRPNLKTAVAYVFH